MGRTGSIAGLAFAAALVAGHSNAGEAIEPMMLEVLLQDEIGVPADTLRQAQKEAGRIFETTGIRLVWITDRMPRAPRYLILKIVSVPPSPKCRNPHVLGIAASSNKNGGMMAWLFYDRIEEERRRVGVGASLLLGHVIAHEMGHLLLPPGSHTAAGLMKAGWDVSQAALASRRILTFSSDQAVAIRTRLGAFSGTASVLLNAQPSNP